MVINLMDSDSAYFSIIIVMDESSILAPKFIDYNPY